MNIFAKLQCEVIDQLSGLQDRQPNLRAASYTGNGVGRGGSRPAPYRFGWGFDVQEEDSQSAAHLLRFIKRWIDGA